MATQFGGSFAPPLDAERVRAYRELADDASPEVRQAMNQLCEMVSAHQRLTRSKRSGTPHPSGRGMHVPLEGETIKALWDLVPWPDEAPGEHANEVAQLSALFDGIDAAKYKPLRDAAFHLLWYAVELARDREPMTTDKL